MIIKLKKGEKAWCATCGDPILIGQEIGFSSDIEGILKIHHADCSKDAQV